MGTTLTSPDNFASFDDDEAFDPATLGSTITTSVQAWANKRQIPMYYWPTATERNAQLGMVGGSFGYQLDTDVTYRYQASTTSWKVFGNSNWTSYSASLTNFAIGTGGSALNRTEWRYEGDLITVRFVFILGSSGASVSGGPRFTLPATAATLNHTYQIQSANCNLFDTSTSGLYPAWTVLASTTIAQIDYISSSALAVPSSSAPFTWAAGDILRGMFSYEPA